MIQSRYGSELLQQDAPEDGPELTYGVANGLLIAIPMWVLIGAAVVYTFQEGTMSESVRLAFMSAAAIEAVLARYAFRKLWTRLWRGRLSLEGWPTRIQAVQGSTLRHTGGFAALAIAFLHYLFWDVNLQIATLSSVTVFVTVAPLQKLAA